MQDKLFLTKSRISKLIITNILLIFLTVETFIHTALFDLVLIGSILCVTLAILIVMWAVVDVKIDKLKE